MQIHTIAKCITDENIPNINLKKIWNGPTRFPEHLVVMRHLNKFEATNNLISKNDTHNKIFEYFSQCLYRRLFCIFCLLVYPCKRTINAVQRIFTIL